MRLLPNSQKERYEKSGDDESMQMRVICDFISGMTDEYAARFFERIFQPHKGSVFDRM